MVEGTVKVAVLGTGSAGMRHLRAIGEMSGVEAIAVPKRDARVQELRGSGFTAAPDVSSAVDMGATLGIIATDTAQHVADGLSCVQLGLELLVEKPLGVDTPEGLRLAEAAARQGRRVFGGCVLRFSRSLNTFRDLLHEVGSLHSVLIECRSYLPDWRPQRPYGQSYSSRAGEGGVLLDLIHDIDYAGWLFGWPETVQARLRNLGRLGIQAEEMAEVRWETAQGCQVSVGLDYLSRPARRGIRACGELGTIEWDGMADRVTLDVAGETVREVASVQSRDQMFLDQDRAFVDVEDGNRDPRLTPVDDGLRALAVCDAARRASNTSREERVAYP